MASDHPIAPESTVPPAGTRSTLPSAPTSWSRALVARGPGRGLLAAWTRFRQTTVAFRVLAAKPPADGDAGFPRWLEPVALAGRAVHATPAEASRPLTYEVTLRPSSRVAAWCGVTKPGPGAVTFTIAAEVPALEWRQERTLVVGARDGARSRGWRPLVLSLPRTATPQTALVHLSVSGAPAGADQVRGALWGDPRVESRRRWRERWHAIVSLLWRLRYAGVTGTSRYLREIEASDSGEGDRYREWLATHTPSPARLEKLAHLAASLSPAPRISVLTPVHNTDPRWLRACIDSVRQQVYPHWELCLADDGSTSRETAQVLQACEGDPRIRVARLPASLGVSAATNAALALATGDFVALLDHDDTLAPDALFEVARACAGDTDVLYTDEDKLDDAGGRCEPFFKPDWSPDYLRSTMYACHLLVMRTSLVREAGGFRSRCDGAQDHDILLRVSERTSRIRHLPLVLYHWRKSGGSTASSGFAKTWALEAGLRAVEDHMARLGLPATVSHGVRPGLYTVRHRLDETPLVSVIIPTAGCAGVVDGVSVSLVERCLASVRDRSTYGPVELVIVDSGLPARVEGFLRTVPHVRARFPEGAPFNFSQRINHGARAANGRYFVLLNDDIEVESADWIEALLEHAQQPGVGAVGARLLYPDGRIQHAGIVTGVCGIAAHAFYRHPGSTVGYGFSTAVVRNYSAVTAACLMTARAVWERLGGFDERYALDFNDLDYCLRARDAGLRVVYTPHATLTHRESASSGARSWGAADVQTFRARWSGAYEDDPYYGPHLSRDSADFRIRTR